MATSKKAAIKAELAKLPAPRSCGVPKTTALEKAPVPPNPVTVAEVAEYEVSAPPKRRRGAAALAELRAEIAIHAESMQAKRREPNYKFTREKMLTIFDRVSKGESVSKVLRDPGMPDPSSFHDVLNADPDLELLYSRAMQRRAEHFADELAELSDMALGGSSDDVAALKLMVNTRQWIASRLLPKKYGDKVTVAGDAENPLVTNLIMSSADLVKKIKGD